MTKAPAPRTTTARPRDVLTPESLALIQTVARAGSLAGAARELGLVPSALTYRVRQIEDALDVLLFDRSTRQVQLTPAGAELLREGEWLLQEIDAVANRVRRVATGWEPQFTLAVDSLITRHTLLELVEAFYALAPPTQLRIRAETLSGTWEAMVRGHADIAIGGVFDTLNVAGVQIKPLGDVPFVFAVAPHHPLASAAEPLPDALIARHRAVAVADSTTAGKGITVGLLGGQEVLTVPNMQSKLEAQLRGLGCGFLPECLAAPFIASGRLVVRRVERPARIARVGYAWRTSGRGRTPQALAWWLKALESPKTRQALLAGSGSGL